MEKLPIEITADILCVFLPMVSQLQCRQVCKTWLYLLPKPKKGLLYAVSQWEFYFSEQKNHDEQQPSCLGTKLEPGLIISSYFTSYDFMIVGSSNGLVCYVGDILSTTKERKIYLGNPVTGELIRAPADKWGGYSFSEWGIGFGYDRSSNKYKVVRVLVNCNPYQDGTIQVYTLRGGAVWRSKSSVINKQRLVLSRSSAISPSMGVFVGGALHWINHNKWYSLHGQSMTLVSFDLEHEAFKLLPLNLIPSDERYADNRVRLMELGGNLCVIDVVPSKHVIIWEYMQDVCTWSTKCSMAWEDYSSWFEPFALTKSDDEKCLLWYNAVLSCYDPETDTLRKIDETLKKFMDECNPSAFTTTRATPHVNSLVSLKAIMDKKRWKEKKSSEENRKRKASCS